MTIRMLMAVGLICAGCTGGVADDDDLATLAAAGEDHDGDRRNPNPGIAPPDSRPHGQSYGEWAADLWRWALAQPTNVNPIIDETGEHCGVGQQGKVWFLAGGFGGTFHRECTVPHGRALFFPIVNAFWLQFASDPDLSIPEIRAILDDLLAGTELSATLDGRPLVDLERYRTQSPVITARLPLDNPFGVAEGDCPLDRRGRFTCRPFTDTGFYLYVRPLPRGEHTLHFSSTAPDGFTLDITYTLHIE